MHSRSLGRFQHSHVFLGGHHDANERRTWKVVALTTVMMVVEIGVGTWSGSMALLADGWHMATHAGALLITGLAYSWARRRAEDSRFVFGTGKVGDLAGFSSALLLAVIAGLIGYESLQRLLMPQPIAYTEALAVAVVGLAVNLASAWLLRDADHDPHPGTAAGHRQGSAHADHNLRSAYLHVLADALTSLLAIAALVLGPALGWAWLDPLVGIATALVIARWALGLMRASGAVLVDMTPDAGLSQTVRSELEQSGDRVSDLHLWRLGPGQLGLIVTIVSHAPQEPESYRERLRRFPELAHVTIETVRCG